MPPERMSEAALPAPRSGSCLELFPTPVFVFGWAEAERRKNGIIAAVEQRQKAGPGIARTNRHGWHSEIDLPSWPEPDLQALTRWVAACAQEASSSLYRGDEPVKFGPWRMNGWANINPPGGFNELHHHALRNWHWSACYYVELGAIPLADSGGALVLEERGMGLLPAGAPPRSFRLVPSEGQLAVFPSWLWHKVEPHRSGGDRISIAFNLYNAAIENSRLWEHRPTWKWRSFPRLMRRIAARRGTPDGSRNAVPPGTDVTP